MARLAGRQVMDPNVSQTPVLSDHLRTQIVSLRDMMLTVHYFAEASWLAAAVEFPVLCHSDVAQGALRHAATIAWQFGFPAVTAWLNGEVIRDRAARTSRSKRVIEGRLPEPESEVG